MGRRADRAAATAAPSPKETGRVAGIVVGAGVAEGTDALRIRRGMAENAPMKTVIYMVGALALIVVGSITWSTMLLGSH